MRDPLSYPEEPYRYHPDPLHGTEVLQVSIHRDHFMDLIPDPDHSRIISREAARAMAHKLEEVGCIEHRTQRVPSDDPRALVPYGSGIGTIDTFTLQVIASKDRQAAVSREWEGRRQGGIQAVLQLLDREADAAYQRDNIQGGFALRGAYDRIRRELGQR